MFLVALFMLFICLIQKKNIKVPYIGLTLFLISFIPLLQYWLGIVYFFGEAITFFFYMLALATIFTIGVNFSFVDQVKKNQVIIIFVSIILVACVFSVWIQLRQWLLFEGSIWVIDIPPNGRPFANMAQPNQLSTLLIMGLVSIIYLFEKQYLHKFSACFLTFFLQFGLVLTQSRTAWVIALFFLLWWLLKSKVSARLTVKSLIIWYFIFFLLWFYLPYLSRDLGVTSVRGLTDRATTGLDRLGMWQQIFAILKDAPLFGYGWGQLNVAQLSNNSDMIATPLFGYSHNLFLDILVWNGLGLGLILVIFMTLFLANLAKSLNDRESIVLFAIIGAVFIHSMFEYPFAYAYFLLPVGFLFGFLYSKQSIKLFSIQKKWCAVYLFSCSFLMIFYLKDYKEVEYEYELMRYENAQLRNINTEESKRKINLLDNLLEYIWFVRQPLDDKVTKFDLDRIRKIVYRYPDRPVLYKYIQVLYLNNKNEEANKMLKLFNSFFNEKLTKEKVNTLSK
ncbi:PglL family O-oligosaccharyltransferase [Acinetobacter courvalinii]|uniref:PglL family O-oligosaccharyltransferase n=1 Tax=Acinetobacter courvalinii TaxID=280147 RepID=UPI0021CE6504|nr:Wzy polymerase domain-containing protein [Acinetobacter courvalinii]MCU4368382.1 O-antigen ligase C-terminal domain-containing protein [Acinetobacter courvalinii]MCU4446752.1 O-antigen ligase C-terminal domain-containing protein [Acinetobacter courvalinii]